MSDGYTVQRVLARLAHARPAELAASLWSFVYFFALLAAYYVLRPIRDEMAMQAGQAALSELFTSVFLTTLAPAYSGASWPTCSMEKALGGSLWAGLRASSARLPVATAWLGVAWWLGGQARQRTQQAQDAAGVTPAA